MSRPPRGPVDPVVCVLTKRGRLTVAEPLFDPGERISLPGKAMGDARIGDLVLIGGGKRGARVVRRIGRPTIARDVLEGLMLDKGLRRSFPYRVEEEATEVKDAVPGTGSLENGRRDLRELPTFTIDPIDARDFDDAISADDLGGGRARARVVRRIGRPTIARDVLEGLMLDKGLRRSFPYRVEEEATEVKDAVPGTGSLENGRRDLRELPTFTIDPIDARDFDDAISAEDLGGGRARVWVHIADVSAFVRPDGVIELEAFRRGTSVYVPGAVEPMLPQALSNDACSLRPHVDRLTVTVEMEIEGAEVRSVAFHRSIIRSDARLNYDQIDEVFAGRERAEDPWAQPLAVARRVATALHDARQARGSALDVESTEPSFEFDDRGNVVAVHHDEQTESHRLIEHLMILANEQVAEFLAERKVPTLYRVHERPDPRGVENLVTKLDALGVPTPPVPDSETMTPQQAADAIGEISRTVSDYVRTTGRGASIFPSLVLRALKKAYYSPQNLGHAGLASPCYCHFTSPIRRYPDLVVHRGLLAALGVDDARPHASDMDEAGAAASAAERRALDVERSAMDVCFAFLLEGRLREDYDQSFEGEITGLIGAGAFVRFGDEGFEGFLPRRRIRGDRWHLNDTETALVGEHTAREMKLGDPLTVQVDSVDAPRGRVDLYMVIDG